MKEADAQEHYELIIQKFQGNELDSLRIEKVGKFYTVRLGKFGAYTQADDLLNGIKPKLSTAIIIEADIQAERIVNWHSGVRPVAEDLYSISVRNAQKFVREGKNQEALTILAPFVSEPSQYPVAVSDYIVILVWEGKYDNAITLFESLPDSFPKRNYLVKNIAKAYYDNNRYAEALSHYEALLGVTSADGEVQKGVVYSLTRMGEFSRGLNYVDEFLKNSPDALELLLSRAVLLARLGNYPGTLKQYHALGERDDIDRIIIDSFRDDLLASLNETEWKKIRDGLAGLMRNGDKGAYEYYLRIIIIEEDYSALIKTVASSGMDINQHPVDLQTWIAWAYFKTYDTATAKSLYQNILDDQPRYPGANIGLSYCLTKEGLGTEAVTILNTLLADNPRHIQAMFARAYTFEQSGRFWSAVEDYDRILTLDPQSLDAKKLRLMALSDIGASTHAGEVAKKEFPEDAELYATFTGDTSVDRIRWEEFSAAKNILEPQLEDGGNIRAMNDYVLALTENTEMEEAIQVYDEMLERGKKPPPWVLDKAANAYLYLEQPYKALELYDRVLEVWSNYNSRLNRFYTLQELRKWEEAKKAIDDLDRDSPEFLSKGQFPKPNWDKIEIKLARGWFLLYEDRLREGEEYFLDLHERAPAHTNFRTGLSYAYLWQGLPRKALREFEIGNTLDPKNVPNRIGKATALNTLASKELAREEAKDLLQLHPKNKHVQNLDRRLQLEEMTVFFTDFVFSSDDDGFDEMRSYTKLTRPVSLYTDVYGFILWQRSSEDTVKRFFHRGGLGVGHIFNSTWRASQQFAVNYDDGKDFGSLTTIECTPNDYWTLKTYYDSFSTDVDLHARIFDIEANKMNATINYRESDRRRYSLSFSRLTFSDNNKRDQGLFEYNQGLYIRNNWKMRFLLDFYASANSLDNAPYFNPDNDLGISVTHLTEHTAMQIYRKAFVHRLYLSFGMYKQSGFSRGLTGAVRYEHDIAFRDTHTLLYGLSLDRNIYDGETVTGYSLYLTWSLLF